MAQVETVSNIFEALRYSSGRESTLGLFFQMLPDLGRRFLCYLLEDEFRTLKLAGETRIPAGEYRLVLRKEGGLHAKYGQRFPDIHKGMIWLKNVPNFKWVYMHLGNKDDDSLGCLLVGDGAHQNITEEGFQPASVAAYRRIYPIVAQAIESRRGAILQITDYDGKHR